MAEISIDFGEYGTILVDTQEADELPNGSSGTEKVSALGDAVQKTRQILATPIEVERFLKLPLTGLTQLLLASLPEPSEDDSYDLDTFTVEFNLGLKAEIGANAGAVAKIMPEGAFKCTYTWKRKANLKVS